jgi:hypothetical protein
MTHVLTNFGVDTSAAACGCDDRTCRSSSVDPVLRSCNYIQSRQAVSAELMTSIAWRW